MLIATLCFSLMDLMAKLLADQVPTTTTLWARYAGQMIIVTMLILPRLKDVLQTDHPFLQAFRALVLLSATGFFFSGFRYVSLVETTTIMQLAPIIIMLGAAVLLGERFGIRRAVAAGVALLGALIVLRPGSAEFSWAILLPIGGMLCYSAYNLATRLAGRDEDVWTSLFYTGVAGTLVLSGVAPFYWEPTPISAIAPLILVGAFGAAGQLLLIRALSLAEASLLAPFSYSALLFASFWQITFFGDWPDFAVYLGALVIIGAGLYVWHRETRGDDARR